MPIAIIISVATIAIVSLSLLSLSAPTLIPPPLPPEVPTVESNYYPGVSVGDYVTYGNFVCNISRRARAGGLWTFPTETKGKSGRGRYVSAQFSLYKWYNETTGEWIGDDCGTYYLDSVPGENSDGGDTYMNGFNHDNTDYHIVEVDIGHQVNPLGQDYWWFGLIWTLRQPDPNTWESYFLKAWTDKDGNPEVTPPEGDVLTVVFEETDPNQSNAVIFSCWDDVNLDGVPDEYHWMGTVSFTVEITRELHVA